MSDRVVFIIPDFDRDKLNYLRLILHEEGKKACNFKEFKELCITLRKGKFVKIEHLEK